MFDRARSPLRWIVLVLACISMLGSYYSYDIPSVLNDQFMDHYHINSFNFNLMSSVYSYPNIVLPFFGGFFIDKLGTKVTILTFVSLIAAGQAVFSLAASISSFPLALVGRVIFGLGGESLSVGQSTLLALWFRGKEMAMAMGINLSVSRLGSVINDNVSPLFSVTMACWIGTFVCVLSVVSAIGMVLTERIAEKRAAEEERKEAENAALLNNAATEPKPEPEKMSLADARHFQLTFWLITLNCVVVYAAVLPFNSNASSFLQSPKYGYSKQGAGRIQSIPFLISACASPFLGGIVDRLGYRVVLVTFAAAALCGSHLLMAFTTVNPAAPFAILGGAYSIYAAALWPSVAFVVKQHQLGTAYGLVTAVQNGGLAVVPLIVGVILDKTHKNYKYSELFFAIVAAVGVMIGFILMSVDRARGGMLNMPSAQASAAADEYFRLQDNKDNDYQTIDDKASVNVYGTE